MGTDDQPLVQPVEDEILESGDGGGEEEKDKLEGEAEAEAEGEGEGGDEPQDDNSISEERDGDKKLEVGNGAGGGEEEDGQSNTQEADQPMDDANTAPPLQSANYSQQPRRRQQASRNGRRNTRGGSTGLPLTQQVGSKISGLVAGFVATVQKDSITLLNEEASEGEAYEENYDDGAGDGEEKNDEYPYIHEKAPEDSNNSTSDQSNSSGPQKGEDNYEAPLQSDLGSEPASNNNGENPDTEKAPEDSNNSTSEQSNTSVLQKGEANAPLLQSGRKSEPASSNNSGSYRNVPASPAANPPPPQSCTPKPRQNQQEAQGKRQQQTNNEKVKDDAISLNRAFKGSGCDVGKVVAILSHRDADQRKLIQKCYKDKYGEELIDRLTAELSRVGGDLKEKVGLNLTLSSVGSLSGTFSNDIKRAVSLWMLDEAERDATIVWQGLQLLTLDLAAVTQVICSRTPAQLRGLEQAYFSVYKSQLLQDIKSSNFRLMGSHKNLLIACLDDNQKRDEETNVDEKLAQKDAEDLYKNGERIWGTNEGTFIDIFTKRNRPHLAAVDAAYNRLYGHSLEMTVPKETSGYFEDGLLILLKCAKNSAKYFAEVLYNAMKGITTSDTKLIRVVVTRAHIDMEEIKKEYYQAYNLSLTDAIHSNTSGPYRTFLINLVE